MLCYVHLPGWSPRVFSPAAELPHGVGIVAGNALPDCSLCGVRPRLCSRGLTPGGVDVATLERMRYISHCVQLYKRWDMDEKDIVAMAGSHIIGSGLDAKWRVDPKTKRHVYDNTYYNEIAKDYNEINKNYNEGAVVTPIDKVSCLSALQLGASSCNVTLWARCYLGRG